VPILRLPVLPIRVCTGVIDASNDWKACDS
jgi:hypothetical protein